jgi:hypothetical protein
MKAMKVTRDLADATKSIDVLFLILLLDFYEGYCLYFNLQN